MWLARSPIPTLSHSLLAQRQFIFARPVKGSLQNLAMWQISLSGAMRVSTVKSVCNLLFEGLPVKPLNILDQESCDRIRVQDDRGKVSYMKVKGT
jgi:hypothetical protein